MSNEADARVALLEALAEFEPDELAGLLIVRKGGFTIHTTEGEDDPVLLCAHPGHDKARGYRSDTLRGALIAALIDAEPEAGADAAHE